MKSIVSHRKGKRSFSRHMLSSPLSRVSRSFSLKSFRKACQTFAFEVQPEQSVYLLSLFLWKPSVFGLCVFRRQAKKKDSSLGLQRWHLGAQVLRREASFVLLCSSHSSFSFSQSSLFVSKPLGTIFKCEMKQLRSWQVLAW